MKDKTFKNNIKDYQKYIDKYINKSPIKANNKGKKKPKQPPTKELDIYQITMMVKTKYPDELEIDMKTFINALGDSPLHVESAPFRIGEFSGFGLRLLITPQRLGSFLCSLGDYIDLTPEIEVKEMDIVSGKAHQIEQFNGE